MIAKDSKSAMGIYLINDIAIIENILYEKIYL